MSVTTLFTLGSYAPGIRTFGPVAIPLNLASVKIDFDVAAHLDPLVELRMAIEISFDSGGTWRDFFGFTRFGGIGHEDDGSVSLVAYRRTSIPQPTNPQRRLRGTFTLTGGSLTTSGTLTVS